MHGNPPELRADIFNMCEVIPAKVRDIRVVNVGNICSGFYPNNRVHNVTIVLKVTREGKTLGPSGRLDHLV